jgi:hypothetical protein
MRVAALLSGFLLAGATAVAGAGPAATSAHGAAPTASATAGPRGEPRSRSAPPTARTAARGSRVNPFRELCPDVAARAPTDDAGSGCARLMEIRTKAVALRAADGGTLSVEHSAELQADIDRVLAGPR